MLGGCTNVISTTVCKLSGIIRTHRWKMLVEQTVKRLDPHFGSLWGNWVMKIYPLYPVVLLKGQFIVCKSHGIKTTSQSSSSEALLYLYHVQSCLQKCQCGIKPFWTTYIVLTYTKIKYCSTIYCERQISFVKKMLLQLLLARLKHTAITIQDNKNMASMCFILIPQVKKNYTFDIKF